MEFYLRVVGWLALFVVVLRANHLGDETAVVATLIGIALLAPERPREGS